MKILIINSAQFGYTAGYFHYCKYLVQMGHSIDYYCIDNDMPRIELNGVNVIYLLSSEIKINWRLSFLRFIKNLNFSQFDVIFLNYQKFAFILLFFGVPSRTILDIRTGDLSENKLSRNIWNYLIKIETLFFKHVTILSESLLLKLKLNPQKCTILPLGSDIMSSYEKQFKELNLLYVGTFFKRNIPQTIKGVALFLKNQPEVNLSYDIIGFGNKLEEQEIVATIIKENLQGKVFFHGRKNYQELQLFFKKANIGFSYIPMTSYFDCQPPTKTFEYILSGMVCIATNTSENKRLITNENGILCNDNPVALCEALTTFYTNQEKYNSNRIRKSLTSYQWKNIVSSILEPLFILQVEH